MSEFTFASVCLLVTVYLIQLLVSHPSTKGNFISFVKVLLLLLFGFSPQLRIEEIPV